jgi:hypothetical protein
MLYAVRHTVGSFVGMGKNAPKKSPAGAACRQFRREAVPSFTLRALRALIAAADTASQNQQVMNLQNECCTNFADGCCSTGESVVSLLVPARKKNTPTPAVLTKLANNQA